MPEDSCPATVLPLSLPHAVSRKFIPCSVVAAGSQVLPVAPCSSFCSRGCPPGRQRQPPASPLCPPSRRPVPAHMQISPLGKLQKSRRRTREHSPALPQTRCRRWTGQNPEALSAFGSRPESGWGDVTGPDGRDWQLGLAPGKTQRGPIGPPRLPSASAEGRVGKARSCRCLEF